MLEALDQEKMAQKDRVSIPLEPGEREDIESCRNDEAWKALPLSSKILVLLRERMRQVKEGK